MGGSQPAGTTSQVQRADPWTGQQPYLKQGFAGAQNLYENYSPGYYPGSTNAPVNEWQGNALQGLYTRGMQGSAPEYAAQNLATDTLSGGFLSAGNPYFGDMARQISETVSPLVSSQFEGAGRYGSGAHTYSLASALTNKIGDLAYQNYGDERMRQGQAMALAPSLAQTDISNLGTALQAGNLLQGQQQKAIDADAARYNYYQQLPQQQLNNYLGSIQGNYGGTQTTATPYFNNTGAGILSLATGILGLL